MPILLIPFVIIALTVVGVSIGTDSDSDNKKPTTINLGDTKHVKS